MHPTPRFSVQVDAHGRVHFDNRLAFDTFCSTLAKSHCELMIRPWQKRRTQAQNRAWWKLVIGAMSEWNGEEPEQWHKRIRRKFGCKSTSRLTVAEFEDLRERVIRWAAETHGVVIPDPSSVWLD